MRTKKLFALLLAGSMMASVLTGCWGGGKDDNASSGTDGDSDITWTDPDYDEDEVDPTKEYTIAVNVGENATVDGKESPVQLKVKDGKDVSFVIKAADGYVINAVKIDDEPIDESYITGVIPGEQVTVTLKNVSGNHEVTATCVKRTYKVGASQEITVTSGASVEAGGTVTFTVTKPDPTYDVAVSVTVGGSPASYTYDQGTQIYTVTNVNGDVSIGATFTPSPVSSVTIKTDLSNKNYNVGDVFQPNMTVTVTYENGYSTDVTLNANNTSVEPATVNAETESVTITSKDNSAVKVNYSFTGNSVTVNPTKTDFGESDYLTQEEVNQIQEKFNTAVENAQLSGISAYHENSIKNSLKTKKDTQGQITINYFITKVTYTYEGARYEGAAKSLESAEAAISDFFINKADGIKAQIGRYDPSDAYMLVDGEDIYIWIVW